MKKPIKTQLVSAQSKKGKYSSRLSNALALGTHESFRSNDSFYRLLVESLIGYGIFTTDKKGNISSWNAGAQKLFGYKEKEIIGKNASIIFKPEDIDRHKLQSELKKASTSGRTTIEGRKVRQDGTHFWASGLIFSLSDKKSLARGFTFIVRDLTEKHKFERRKDSFISTATHELKTPITSMKLYAQIVEQEVKKSGDKANLKSITALNKQLDKLMTLMDYLLDVAKIQEGKLGLEKTSFDLEGLTKETIATIQLVSKKHTIVYEGKMSGVVHGDSDRLGQVLTNLITNAIKYSPGESKIIVRGTDDPRRALVSVRDFGLGIAKSEQPEIFQRFYRASGAVNHKIDGIGLGLYVSQQIVAAHQGKIWLKSQPNKGSTFSFSLPRK